MVFKKLPKNSIVGFTIVGSKVKGSRNLLFKTKKEAKAFTRNIGGLPKRAIRIGRIKKPFTSKFKLK